MAKEEGPVKVADLAKKKRTKNAPDKPQPTWMFPSDKENPVLNPNVFSEKQKRREAEENEKALKILEYKSVSAPMKAAPPSQLLSLVGAFLTTYGFNSTSRNYTMELNARKKLDEWNIELGKKFDKGMSGLVEIYEDWHKEWHKKRELEGTSSEEDEDATTKGTKKMHKKRKLGDGKVKAKADETSSSGSSGSSSDESDLDVEMKDAPAAAKEAKKATDASSSSGTSFTSSESDADDEKDVPTSKATSTKPTANGLVKNLKRKASSSESLSSSSDSDSDSSSSDEREASPAKKKKVDSKMQKVATSPSVPTLAPATKKDKKAEAKAKAKAKAKARSSSSSSSDNKSDTAPANKPLPASSSDDSSSSSEPDAPPSKSAKSISKEENAAIVEARKASTDSSATLEGGSAKKTSSSSSSSSATSDSSSSDSDDSDKPAKKSKKSSKAVDPPAPTITKTKRKRSASPNVEVLTPNSAKLPKKRNTPFSRVPQDTKVHSKLASNAYVPYDYAQRAHDDLIVTKGKAFTKEKNRKKRGSYRGGPIDISGGKGIKFDD